MSNQTGTSSSVISACYLLTNSNDPANLGMYVLENGQPLFNIGILFAANINGTYDQPELYLNDTVTAALESGIIPQLQEQGIKVTLSILGNHQEAGISTLTGDGPTLFAQQLADVVTQYGLDGIDFDDEYCTGTTNESSFPLLVSALRGLLPDAILTLYFIGGASYTLTYDNINVGTLLDYAYNPYYSQFNPVSVPPMTNSQIGAAAIDMGPDDETYTRPELAANLAQQTLAGGYGVYIYYNLVDQDISEYLSSVSSVLYLQNTIYKGAAGAGQ
jgi:Glycosyl hydrolases family 18